MRERFTSGHNNPDKIRAAAKAHGVSVSHLIEYVMQLWLGEPCDLTPRTRGWPKGRKRK